jgi:hypothetical protein
MFKDWLRRICQTPYVQRAISDQADLSVFRQKPSARTIWGLIIIGISYTIGWPLIAVLGIGSIYWEMPLLIIVGGPVAYGISHLVFILGAFLAGADYAKDFFRWATRVAMEKIFGAELDTLRPAEPTEIRPNKE